MYKKILIFLLVLSILLVTGCQSYKREPFTSKDLIYFVMTDRFYDGNIENNSFPDVNKKSPKSFHGGDLKGVTQKLDYIKSLGATAIWLTPVFKNEYKGYHGYWITDFYQVDPHLGSLDDLKELVKEAHKRDIKVVLDYVVNHTGYKTSWLKDKNKKDWFNPKKKITNWNDQNQIEKGWIFGLPDLNQDNPEVKKYFIDNALWWIKETNIDGFRLDTVKHVPKSFWSEFSSAIKEKYPNFFLLGEVWSENPRYLEQYHQVGIDSLTNYPLYKGIRKTFTRFGKANSLVNAIKAQKAFSNPYINGIFVDNHDNKRLITASAEYGNEYLKQALTFIMTYPGIPIIYYGTEIAMEGGNDPDNRRDMEWDVVKNSRMLKYYKDLSSLRSSNDALTVGEFDLLNYDSYFLSYRRKLDNKEFLIIYNLKPNEKQVEIDVENENYKDVFNNTTYNSIDNKLKIKLKPLEVVILTN